MTNLWSLNTPANFWQCDCGVTEIHWREAIQRAIQPSGLPAHLTDLDSLLEYTLGEAQFGCDHWELSAPKRLYYSFKWMFPRRLRNLIRSRLQATSQRNYALGWPVEDRYARFLWETLRQVLMLTGRDSIRFKNFWPGECDFALTLTHDIETGRGQSFVPKVAELEESLGFRSSFNFVIKDYAVNHDLIQDLAERGFEIGLHGLKHDNKLFSSEAIFKDRAKEINHYLKAFGAVGFRSPLTLRQPEWMQALNIEYDLSFFDTDPWEPICGGTMSIWPFMIGHIIELPYTLAQDNTLVNVLMERTPRIWLEKVAFIERYHGLALVNSHPDYLCDQKAWKAYADFLKAMKERPNYWQALPRDAARWWCMRAGSDRSRQDLHASYREARLIEGQLAIY